ncbi:MAG: DUF5615 family PIN-like protein [Dehalococcoidia bacterium]
MTIRLYLDEDVLPGAAQVLRRRGFDVTSAQELGNLQWTDEERLAWATAEGRVILSFNFRDFQTLFRRWHQAARHHSGILISYRQYPRRELGEFARRAQVLLDALGDDGFSGALWALEQYRYFEESG